ncbi:MAG: S8 family peptidase, partial [Acidobacteria bacterium]|nr:S8 family peptidase [Acidobacteriota bacterium]
MTTYNLQVPATDRDVFSPRARFVARLAALALLAFALFVATADAQGRRARVADDLQPFLKGQATGAASVILTGPQAQVDRLAARHGLRVSKRLRSGAVVEATPEALETLSRDVEVASLSADRAVMASMAVTNEALGADQAWAGFEPLAGATGRNVGVALIDSGVNEVPALRGRIVAHVDFTNPRGRGRDEHGHGTHLAGIIAGNGRNFQGVAPEAKIVSLKVLNGDGSGRSSDVIDALDWVVENKQRFNLSIVNLSLGHPVMESAFDDPLVAAVQRAVKAGLFVVVSAGNLGKTPDGRPIAGAITSPGNAPGAFTVGAVNTKQTAGRSDDVVASYSSRGPTYKDQIVKPDVVAPGNKVTSLGAPGSMTWRTYPELRDGQFMTMSGTSQAAAVAAGAAAVLREVNPRLSPVQMKWAFQVTASRLAEPLIAQGAGSLNLAAAAKLAGKQAKGGLPQTVIGGETVESAGIAFHAKAYSAANGQTLIWGDT